jgi:hypothetical protein
VVYNGEPAWPCYWYFRNQTHVETVDAATIRQAALVIVPAGTLTNTLRSACGVEGYTETGIEPNWHETTVPLRRAWLHPWPETDPWRAWWHYFWTRETWTEPGEQAPVTILERAGQ